MINQVRALWHESISMRRLIAGKTYGDFFSAPFELSLSDRIVAEHNRTQSSYRMTLFHRNHVTCHIQIPLEWVSVREGVIFIRHTLPMLYHQLLQIAEGFDFGLSI